MPVLFRLLDRRITVFFLATILSAAFFVPAPYADAINRCGGCHCDCRDNPSVNEDISYDEPVTGELATLNENCQDRCFARIGLRCSASQGLTGSANNCTETGASLVPSIYCWCGRPIEVAAGNPPAYTCENHRRGPATPAAPEGYALNCNASGPNTCRAYCVGRGTGWVMKFCDPVYNERSTGPGCTQDVRPGPDTTNTNANTNGPVNTDPGSAAARAGRTAILSDPLGGVSIPQLLGRVINVFLGISGSLALVVFVYGGFEWLTSAGNPEKIKKGKDAFVWATLGLMVVFGAYAIVNFILRAILSAAG